MILLKHKILKNVLLRRTKKGRAADLALPPRMVGFLVYMAPGVASLQATDNFSYFQLLLRRDSLDIKEEDYYTSLYNDSRAQFNT